MDEQRPDHHSLGAPKAPVSSQTPAELHKASALDANSHEDTIYRTQSSTSNTPSPTDSEISDASFKKHPSVHARQISTNSTDDELKFEPPPVPTKPIEWKTSLLHTGPLVGLMMLTLAFVLLWASFGILWASHNQPISSWKYQPTVYLAILTAISNKALALAAIKGAIVSWWLKATRGTTIKRLHYDWGMGIFVYKALAAGRNFNALAFACICATLVIMDGPLLQRASSVRSVSPGQLVELEITAMPELPAYMSGVSSFDIVQNAYTTSFAGLFALYTQGSPITNGISGCPGVCTATIRAPALALDRCESIIKYINYTAPLSAYDENILKEEESAPLLDREIFGVIAGVQNGTREHLIVSTSLSDDSVARTCAGNLNITDCYYFSAIGEYDVIITDGTITLPPGPITPRIIALANNTALTNESITKHNLRLPESDDFFTTLSGFAVAADLMFFSEVSLSPAGGGRTALETGGASWFTYQHQTNFEAFAAGSDCAPAWSDPRPNIMAAINELAFRAGLYYPHHFGGQAFPSAVDPGRGQIDTGLDIVYNTTGHRVDSILVYQSDFSYFIAAAVVQLMTIFAILYTFYGFWRLGRDTSFSPIEIAKSFDAPLLRNEESNLRANRLAKRCRDRAVLYGRVDDDNIIYGDAQTGFYKKEKLVFGEKDCVRPVTRTSRA